MIVTIQHIILIIVTVQMLVRYSTNWSSILIIVTVQTLVRYSTNWSTILIIVTVQILVRYSTNWSSILIIVTLDQVFNFTKVIPTKLLQKLMRVIMNTHALIK